MNKDVIISGTGTQVNEHGETDGQELITKGSYYLKNGAYFIIYNESEITGMSGTTTFLKAEPAKVTLNRTGTSEHRQVFEPGIKNLGNYVTPFGVICMAVTASKVEVNLTDMGGSIKLKYELEVENQKIGDNSLSLLVQQESIDGCRHKKG